MSDLTEDEREQTKHRLNGTHMPMVIPGLTTEVSCKDGLPAALLADFLQSRGYQKVIVNTSVGETTVILSRVMGACITDDEEFCILAQNFGDIQDLMNDVEAFHIKFEHARPPTDQPRILPPDLYDFRTKFHREESEEYELAQEILDDELSMGEDHDPDRVIDGLAKQLDALVDAVWVHLGTAELQFGAKRFREAWRRVVKANMAKVPKLQAEEGHTDSGRAPKYDIVKPAGWVAPDHTDLVRDYAPLVSE